MIKDKGRAILMLGMLVLGIGLTGWGCVPENTWDLPTSDARRAPKQESQMRFDSFSERWVNCARAINDRNYYLDIPGGLWYYEKRNERNERVKLYITPDPPVSRHPGKLDSLIVDAISLPAKTTDAITGDRGTSR
jgi:hypothetical protein